MADLHVIFEDHNDALKQTRSFLGMPAAQPLTHQPDVLLPYFKRLLAMSPSELLCHLQSLLPLLVSAPPARPIYPDLEVCTVKRVVGEVEGAEEAEERGGASEGEDFDNQVRRQRTVFSSCCQRPVGEVIPVGRDKLLCLLAVELGVASERGSGLI